VHTAGVTTGKVHDAKVMDNLIREDDRAVYGDKGYASDEKKRLAEAAGVKWAVKEKAQAGREHVAAALMNMVGQATVRLALLAANANGYPSLVLIGHLADLDGIRQAGGMSGSLFGGSIVLPANPGFAIALGALAEAAARE